MTQLPIYYINLDARPDRRKFMEGQFARLGLVATRIRAIAPVELTPTQRNTYCNPSRRWSMTENQYCCNLSHAKAWQSLLASDQPRALFLEDDAILSASLPRFLEAVAANDLTNDVLRLEVWPEEHKRYCPVEQQVLPDIGLRRSLTRDAGAAGYILTRDAAARLLAHGGLNTILVDSFLFNPFSTPGRQLDVRYTDPALCIQLALVGEVRAEAVGDAGTGYLDHKRERGRYPLAKLARQAENWLRYDIPRAIILLGLWLRGKRWDPAARVAFKPD